MRQDPFFNIEKAHKKTQEIRKENTR